MVTPRLRTAFSDRSLGSHSFDILNVVLLLGVVFVTLYPMYYIAIVSFSDGKEVLLGRVRFWPRGFNLESYRLVLRDDTVIRALFNSILYTSVGTLINLVLSTLCAYPLSRRDFSGRKLLTLYVAITMFFQGGLIPLYLVVLQLGLLDTMWAIVLVPAINAVLHVHHAHLLSGPAHGAARGGDHRRRQRPADPGAHRGAAGQADHGHHAAVLRRPALEQLLPMR